MTWNWELPNWPKFIYDAARILDQERQFLLSAGKTIGCLKTIETPARNQFVIEILSLEGEMSSKIEGEIFDRASLQSSIRTSQGKTANYSQHQEIKSKA